MSRFVVVALAAAFAVCVAERKSAAGPFVLTAPWTPFHANGSLNDSPSVFNSMAAEANASGANCVWVAGSMGEFAAMSVAERNTLLDRWMAAARPYNFFMIAHVGGTELVESQDLARHAAAAGVDAIAVIPPYYYRPPDVAAVADWLAAVSSAAPSLPMFYYHIPGTSGVNIKVSELLDIAHGSRGEGGKVPALKGVKFVYSDTGDYLHCVKHHPEVNMMWAPEPKTVAFGLHPSEAGRVSVVLAESYMGPYWRKVADAFYNERCLDCAIAHQLRTAEIYATIGGASGPGGPSRGKAVLRMKGVEIGVTVRKPQSSIDAPSYTALCEQLRTVGFFADAGVASPRCTLD
eukprot:TRINITY_DN33958_c0_g1_i1.p1 TRINITY_DN33958_c0_g1~~TRINITY_DN33958_c0_g1_i1.p1  ORF type:complete len:348 (+),score=65.14 TRINITY_DN33958_c0_g1_i1:92-1135(+)